jgi:hypothetical protein
MPESESGEVLLKNRTNPLPVRGTVLAGSTA